MIEQLLSLRGRVCALTSPAAKNAATPLTRRQTILDTGTLAGIIRNTPLVSVDLLIHCRQRGILFGLRVNPPARKSWFVPGGRIRKNEPIEAALHRVGHSEVGLDPVQFQMCRFVGVHEHFYEDNFAGMSGFGTHFVVLAHRLEVDAGWMPAPSPLQHSAYRWVQLDKLGTCDGIHPYCKAYARHFPPCPQADLPRPD